MTQDEKDEIMKKAYRMYPIGTIFLSAYSGNCRTREAKELIWDHYGDGLMDDECGGYVYDRNKWAEIVSLPETKTLPIFN